MKVIAAKNNSAKLATRIAPISRLSLKTREAVSYTHLRAHETVLDLVCRLLLEKKKQIENQHKQSHKVTKHQHTLEKTIISR